MTYQTASMDPYYDHEAKIYCDLAGVLVDTDARFVIDAEWDGSKLIGAECYLVQWHCEDVWQNRAPLVKIIGNARLKRLEDAVLEKWCETAETDRADELGDAIRDARLG